MFKCDQLYEGQARQIPFFEGIIMGKRIDNVSIIALTIITIAVYYYSAPQAIKGLSWFMLDSIAIVTGEGGNLTGLGLTVGLIWAIQGFLPIICLFGFLYILEKLFLKEGGEPVISVEVIQALFKVSLVAVSGIVLFSVLQISMAWDKKIAQEHKERVKVAEEDKSDYRKTRLGSDDQKTESGKISPEN